MLEYGLVTPGVEKHSATNQFDCYHFKILISHILTELLRHKSIVTYNHLNSERHKEMNENLF